MPNCAFCGQGLCNHAPGKCGNRGCTCGNKEKLQWPKAADGFEHNGSCCEGACPPPLPCLHEKFGVDGKCQRCGIKGASK